MSLRMHGYIDNFSNNELDPLLNYMQFQEKPGTRYWNTFKHSAS